MPELTSVFHQMCCHVVLCEACISSLAEVVGNLRKDSKQAASSKQSICLHKVTRGLSFYIEQMPPARKSRGLLIFFSTWF
jgi:hypothetical protein